MSILIRSAQLLDVPALVRLREANAEQHVRLAPAVYRIPDREAVRQYFQEVLTEEDPNVLVSVAEVSGEVVGMVELVLLAEPPRHQILIPRRGADVHTVVLGAYRGRGVGAALVAEAERVAAERGVAIVYAGIFAPNAGAVDFYSASGFGPRGTVLSKEPTLPG